MNVYLHHIETAVPGHAHSQLAIEQTMAAWADNPRTARLIRQVYRRSGIETRHSVLPDFAGDEEAQLFRQDTGGRVRQPSTGERNRCYHAESKPLAERAAQAALKRCETFHASDITHLITVSCTGFYNPGIDHHLIAELGLPPSTERYHLGFMGCYAAFPAMRMAQQFCLADPGAAVMIVCLELCTLHMQPNSTSDSILANALFADGAATAIVSARSPAADSSVLTLGQFHSALVPEGRADMAWDIGDTGFNLALSSYVPKVIGQNIGQAVEELLDRSGLTRDNVGIWAVHPGGKAILDKVEQALGLEPARLALSRETLSRYGNMSSATILFVLDRILRLAKRQSTSICAMAFGPGLTVETATMRLHPARLGQAETTPAHAAESVT
jgi:predicted naringenin-chalcone synthase